MALRPYMNNTEPARQLLARDIFTYPGQIKEQAIMNNPKRKRLRIATATATATALTLTACTGTDSGNESTNILAGVIFGQETPLVACGLSALEEDAGLEEEGIQIEVSHSAQLGGENELLEQVATGEIDMTLSGASTLTTVFGLPDLEMYEAYYLYDDLSDVEEVQSTDQYQTAFDTLPEDAGVYMNDAPWLYGQRHIFGSNSIETTDDLAGLQFRVTPTDISLDSAAAIGANPATTAYDEMYMGLQQGIFDVAEAPLAVIQNEGLHEPADFVNLTGHLITVLRPTLNAEVWDGLSDAQQEAMDEALRAAGDLANECVEEEDAEALQAFEEDPSIEVVDNVDRDAFRKLAYDYFSDGRSWSDEYVELMNLLHDME